MLWETTIDFSKEELDTLNNFAIQYEGSSEEKVPNILLNFPFALEKINVLLDNYLPEDYEKYLVQSWSIYTPKDIKFLTILMIMGIAILVLFFTQKV